MILESWQVEAMGQIVLAAFLGGTVGLERHYHGRAAGFRTHMLVCVGCCLVMILSLHFERAFAHAYTDAHNIVRIDPARLAYSVMSGIGFLGAGAIIKSGITIRGLTTAASLWCIAAIGMACGFNQYFIAIFTTGLVLVSLFGLNVVERSVRRNWYKVIRVVCEDQPDEIDKISRILEANSVSILDVTFARNIADRTVSITYDVRYRDREHTPAIYRALASQEGLRSVQLH